jgi:hypothetical protein
MVVHFNKNKNKIAKVIKSSKEIALQKLIYWRGYFLSFFFNQITRADTCVFERVQAHPLDFQNLHQLPYYFFYHFKPPEFYILQLRSKRLSSQMHT